MKRLEPLLRRLGLGRALPPALDLIVAQPGARDDDSSRIHWLIDVGAWIRGKSVVIGDPFQSRAQQQLARVRLLLDVLDRQEDAKARVAHALRSIIRRTHAIDLFSETGLPRRFGLLHELSERIAGKLLPARPDASDLAELFGQLFPRPEDALWVEALDESTLVRLQSLIRFGDPGAEDWNTPLRDLDEALIFLATRIAMIGSSRAIRSNLRPQRIQDLSFAQLPQAIRAALDHRAVGDAAALVVDLGQLRLLMDAGHRAIEQVIGRLVEHGVSTELVYQLTYLERALDRLENLLALGFDPHLPVSHFSGFLASLIRENAQGRQIRSVVRQNFHLLTRRLVERNAQTGDHYIARSRPEYWSMLRASAGGGVVMAFTGLLKILLFRAHLPGLLQGLAASVNYSVGFVGIQLLGFTLATKQPATTAPALASRLHRVRDPRAMASLIEEIFCLMRSQFIAIVGNVALVIPCAWVLDFLLRGISGSPAMDAHKASATIDSLSILGPSGLYAAFTGLLLCASSLIGAWVDNAVAYHQLGQAYGQDPRLAAWLGPSRARRTAAFLQRNVGGLVSNVSLAFMLGLLPELAVFAGIPLDVRHVTLSSAMLADAVSSLGPPSLLSPGVLAAAAGIALIGIMNVMISFSLALMIAIRARRVLAPERQVIYRAIWQKLRSQPSNLFFPSRDETLTEAPTGGLERAPR